MVKLGRMKKIVDTDGNEYENEDVFLAHAIEAVGNRLKKFDEMDWWTWRGELCWWGDMSESIHDRFVDFLYGHLNRLNTHIW